MKNIIMAIGLIREALANLTTPHFAFSDSIAIEQLHKAIELLEESLRG